MWRRGYSRRIWYIISYDFKPTRLLTLLPPVASDGGLPEVDEVIATVDYTHLGEKVDDFFNVAMGKTASASSEPWNGKASRAIDGTTNQNWNM